MKEVQLMSTPIEFADCTGQLVLVTGASRGIGRGCAVEMARGGADVAVNYRSHPDEANEVVSEIEAMGRKAIAVQGDVSIRDDVDRMMKETIDGLGGLTGLVSNAAFSDREKMIEADLEGFDRTIDVSMWGPFNVLRSALRHWVDNKIAGSAVIVSSPHAYIAVPGAMAYNMAKASIDHMARTAAIEVAKHNIRVNILHPGWTDTPGERKYFTEEQLEEGGKTLPRKRLGTMTEMGRATRFLMSSEADYMTGSTLLVDGGVSLPWWSKRDEGGQ